MDGSPERLTRDPNEANALLKELASKGRSGTFFQSLRIFNQRQG
jgi:hypothetical protein